MSLIVAGVGSNSNLTRCHFFLRTRGRYSTYCRISILFLFIGLQNYTAEFSVIEQDLEKQSSEFRGHLSPENLAISTFLDEAINILSVTKFSCFGISKLTLLLQRFFGNVIAGMDDHIMDLSFDVDFAFAEAAKSKLSLATAKNNANLRNFTRLLIQSMLDEIANFNSTRNRFRNLPLSSTAMFSFKNITNFQQLIQNDTSKLFPFYRHASQTSGQLVGMDQLCDGISDCIDYADERFCSGKFYCKNEKPLYVDSMFVLDGEADCSDSSDEWPERRSRFSLSSKYSLIDSWVLQILVWVIGVVALLGNATVIFCTLNEIRKNYHLTSKLFSVWRLSKVISYKNSKCGQNSQAGSKLPKRSRLVKMWNSVLVLNLACADLLMGIYLTWLAGVSILYEGRSRQQPAEFQYWNFDRKWRTSTTCNILGILLVVSSQASVFSLVSLTSLRLYTVVKPFACYRLKSKYLLIICCCTWVSSILLAVVPILPFFENIFITSAFVPMAQMQPPDINQTAAEEMVRGIFYLSSSDTTKGIANSANPLSWSEMFSYIQTIMPKYSDWMFYGYYSEDSVCMPKLFVNPAEDDFWGYTIALIVINCVSVLYIAIAYSIICFRSTTKSKKARSSTTNFKNRTKFTSTILQKSFDSNPCHQSPVYLPKVDTTTSNSIKKLYQHSCKGHNETAKVFTKPSKKTNGIHGRVAMLVITDCACWLPICIIGFISAAGQHAVPQTAYAITAVVLLPINSALNPLLYSKFMRSFWIKVWSALRIRAWLLQKSN